MNFKLKVWRQPNQKTAGGFRDYAANNIPAEASFLEMLDIVNEGLIEANEDPIAFDSDCREGICGMCSLVINGIPHGPGKAKTTCQLYMRRFQDGDTIWIEPFRAAPFPVVKDLVVDRSALDRIIESGGYITARTGSAPEANSVPIGKPIADWPWKQPHASVAELASLLARILRPCFSLLPKFLTWVCCHKDSPSERAVPATWCARWTS